MRRNNRVLPESLVSNSDYDQSVYTTKVTGSTQGQTAPLNCWKYKDIYLIVKIFKKLRIAL